MPSRRWAANFAEEFELVRSEIDHRQAPVGPQHAGRLDERALRIVEVVQHLVDGDEIGKGGRIGQRIEGRRAGPEHGAGPGPR